MPDFLIAAKFGEYCSEVGGTTSILMALVPRVRGGGVGIVGWYLGVGLVR